MTWEVEETTKRSKWRETEKETATPGTKIDKVDKQIDRDE